MRKLPTELENNGLASAEPLIELALREDVGPGDATCETLIPPDARLALTLRARQECVPAGLPLAMAVFHRLDPEAEIVSKARDGEAVAAGQALLTVKGSARGLLTAERTALNFLQRLSAVATLTAAYVRAANRPDVLILDTRKTTPGYRLLEKYAVRCGGGHNHRMGLYDRIMAKDNHRTLWGGQDERGLGDLVRRAREKRPDLAVEVEVDTLEQFYQVLPSEPEWILLDNMSIEDMIECVDMLEGRTRLEASGGITLETIAEVARTGVHAISVGALTHSAPAVDLGLDEGVDDE